MVFHSLTFAIFLLLVYVVYWQLSKHRQNLFLLLASYVFYGFWDWRFLSLILLSSAVDYVTGQRLDLPNTTSAVRKRWLALSIATNLGILGFFKYAGFFVSSFAALLASFGLEPSLPTLQIILPVGISFYTFQTLSYTCDVYRGKCRGHQDWVEFFCFVAFFPQLVAGPIERAGNMLKQFSNARTFDPELAKDGGRQILWGLAKKLIIADALAVYVDQAYDAPPEASSGAVLAIATYFFALQIYCDFSAYSDIAIGTGKLLGFRLMRNFNYPYFAQSVREFWARWHISLSTWFRDYVYIPLGGNRGSIHKVIRNVLITFTVSGLWHGANWTFVVWGLLNGLYFIPTVWRRHRGDRGDSVSNGRVLTVLRVLFTFHLILLGWVFFRADNLGHVASIFSQVVTDFSGYEFLREALKLKARVGLLLAIEWCQRRQEHPLAIAGVPRPLRWTIYYLLLGGILAFGTFSYRPFIYFQF